MPEIAHEEDFSTNPDGRVRGWLQLFFAAAAIVAVTGIPALIWAAGLGQRVEALERQRETDRRDLREDLREINKKLDAIIERHH